VGPRSRLDVWAFIILVYNGTIIVPSGCCSRGILRRFIFTITLSSFAGQPWNVRNFSRPGTLESGSQGGYCSDEEGKKLSWSLKSGTLFWDGLWMGFLGAGGGRTTNSFEKRAGFRNRRPDIRSRTIEIQTLNKTSDEVWRIHPLASPGSYTGWNLFVERLCHFGLSEERKKRKKN